MSSLSNTTSSSSYSSELSISRENVQYIKNIYQRNQYNLWKRLLKGYNPDDDDSIKQTPLYKWIQPYITATNQTVENFCIYEESEELSFTKYCEDNNFTLQELNITSVRHFKDTYVKLFRNKVLWKIAYDNKLTAKVLKTFSKERNTYEKILECIAKKEEEKRQLQEEKAKERQRQLEEQKQKRQREEEEEKRQLQEEKAKERQRQREEEEEKRQREEEEKAKKAKEAEEEKAKEKREEERQRKLKARGIRTMYHVEEEQREEARQRKLKARGIRTNYHVEEEQREEQRNNKEERK